MSKVNVWSHVDSMVCGVKEEFSGSLPGQLKVTKIHNLSEGPESFRKSQ